MKKLLIFLFAAFLTFSPTSAQTSDCGSGVPCGPIPWRLPVLPNLPSPSPMPTLAVTSSSLNPGDPTSTPVPISSPTPIDLDMAGISSQIDAIGTALAQTPVVLTDSSNLGLINLVANGNCASWTGSFPNETPTGWTKTIDGGASSSNYVSQVGNACRMVSNGTYVELRQAILTNGEDYNVSVTITEITGTLSLLNHSGATIALWTTPGVKTVSYTANGSNFLLVRNTAMNAVITNITVYPADNPIANMGTSAGTFFGYARGLSADTFGPIAPIVGLLLVAMLLIFTVKVMTFLLPVLAALFGIIRKVVTTVLEFLPL